jgi:hypothetical protein
MGDAFQGEGDQVTPPSAPEAVSAESAESTGSPATPFTIASLRGEPYVVEGVTNSDGKPITVYGKIGTDPDHLRQVAEAIVDREEAIEDMEVENLRALIDAVQAHPRARLASDRKEGEPARSPKDCEQYTTLRIVRGAIRTEDCDIPIRVNLLFDRAAFQGDAWFGGAAFQGGARFDRAAFQGDAWFDRAAFQGDARFGGAAFQGNAWFDRAAFQGDAWFDRAAFQGGARFGGAAFQGGARFDGAAFQGDAWFDRAAFQGGARFDRAAFQGEAWFGGATFAARANFDSAVFQAAHIGDFRGVTVGTASASFREVQEKFPPHLRPFRSFPWRLALATMHPRQLARSTIHSARHGWLGWHIVRSISTLAILNRVSLIALVTVPLLATAYLGSKPLINELAANGAAAPGWFSFLVRAAGEGKLGLSPVLTFFAAACITLGLFLYQVFADETIKRSTEEEHFREFDARYPEESKQRNDGLRRALERLEDQAKVRFHRHPNFVKHHGELIWMPPRDKIDWFEDQTKEEIDALQAQVTKAWKAAGKQGKEPKVVPNAEREGYVPGAERARICIEEGARAEYWLRAHHNWLGAWASFTFYVAGIALLLWVLGLQTREVLRAADMWPRTTAQTAPQQEPQQPASQQPAPQQPAPPQKVPQPAEQPQSQPPSQPATTATPPSPEPSQPNPSTDPEPPT